MFSRPCSQTKLRGNVVGAPRRGATPREKIVGAFAPNATLRAEPPINIRTQYGARSRLGDALLLPSLTRAHLTQMRLLPSSPSGRKCAYYLHHIAEKCFLINVSKQNSRQRSRSTSPRRDPKRRCSRRVCDKRDPQSGTSDKHSRVNSSKGAPRRFAPTIIAHQGAFDANAPTTFTAMPESVFLSMFANNGHLQICMGSMFAIRGLLQICMGQMFTNIRLMQI